MARSRTASVSVIAWNQGDKLVTLDELKAMDDPKTLGSRHRPVRHDALVETIQEVFPAQGLKLSQMQLVVNSTGDRLFGGCVVTPQKRGLGRDLVDYKRDGNSFAFIFRHGTGGHMALRGAAGNVATICSNLDMLADEVILARKHTTGLRLESELERAIERYVAHQRKTVETLDAAEQFTLTDEEAKLAIFDAFHRGDLATKYFGTVARNYFAPVEAARLRQEGGDSSQALSRLVKACGEDPARWTDCSPRTRRGLHAAFTRTIRPLGPDTKLKYTRNVARILTPGNQTPTLN